MLACYMCSGPRFFDGRSLLLVAGFGLLAFAIAFFVASAMLLLRGAAWTRNWDQASAIRAGVFCYRDLARSLVSADENG